MLPSDSKTIVTKADSESEITRLTFETDLGNQEYRTKPFKNVPLKSN